MMGEFMSIVTSVVAFLFQCFFSCHFTFFFFSLRKKCYLEKRVLLENYSNPCFINESTDVRVVCSGCCHG